MIMRAFLLVAVLVTYSSAHSLSRFAPEARSWLPEDAPVVESSDSEATPSESSPIPSTSASETVTSPATADKSQSSPMSDLLTGTSPLAATAEKPEAFLIHFKPKTGQTSKSKYMLLLKLPDGSTETIESNSETLAALGSQPAKSIPAVEESTRNIQQTTQNQFDDDIGFDDEPQRGGSSASAGAASGNRFGSSSAAAAAAGGSLSSVSAVASAGGSAASIEQQLQSDDEQQQQQDDDRTIQQDTQQQVNDDSADGQQQAVDDQALDEQQKIDSDRDGGSSTSADPAAGSGYGQQPQQSPLAGLTASPNAGSVYTSYAGTGDQQVPVILIALPPRASALSQRQTLNRLLGALRAPATAQLSSAPGTKGGSRAAAALSTGARKGGSVQRGGKTSPAAQLAATKGGRAPASPSLVGATKGGSSSLRLGPLSPVAQIAAKGGVVRVKGTRGQGNTNSPDNPQPRHPTGGFGGYGNSHTPSPNGGYGSVAMRLAAKGIPLPTERDVQRPATLKAILSLARPANTVNAQGGRKSARLSVRTYA